MKPEQLSEQTTLLGSRINATSSTSLDPSVIEKLNEEASRNKVKFAKRVVSLETYMNIEEKIKEKEK